jgi:hypothetical protein
LDFVHRLYFNKIAVFRKLDLLPSSGKTEGQNPYVLGPLAELASDLVQLPKRSNFIEMQTMDKSKKPPLQIETPHRQNPLEFI